MSCSNVQIEYLGNGARVDYTFPFTYEDELEVHVAAWDETKLRFVDVGRDTWEFQNATTIRFITPPAAEGSIGARFIIYRETDLDEMEVTFYPGSSIRAQDLNTNFEQLRDAIQEGWCRVSEEFYEYLDEYIWDVRDTYVREDQINELATPTDDKITTSAAQAARYDTYTQDNIPATLPYEQDGKRWYDTELPQNYIWNADIGAWVDYARTGPQGPKGEDGHHIVMVGLEPPTKRPSGDPIGTGDIWLNNCTAEVWIFYRADKDDTGQWISFGSGGIPGPKGATGTFQAQVALTAPTTRQDGSVLLPGDIWFNSCSAEAFFRYDDQWINFVADGTKGDTGYFKAITGMSAPTHREDGSRLQNGDLWLNTCTGEMFMWYDCQWLSTAAGGPQGVTGPQGPKGDDGSDGSDGAAATIAVGSTTTGAAGTQASVSNSGTNSAAVFNFTIPQGAKGDKGDTGDGSTLTLQECTTNGNTTDKAIVINGKINLNTNGSIVAAADNATSTILQGKNSTTKTSTLWSDGSLTLGGTIGVNLAGSTAKITLNSDGSSDFQGDVFTAGAAKGIGSFTEAQRTAGMGHVGGGKLMLTRGTGTDAVVQGYLGNATTPSFAINAGGDGSFADGDILLKNEGDFGGKVDIKRSSGSDALTITDLDSTVTVKLNANGSSEFAGNVASGKADLSANGTRIRPSGLIEARRDDADSSLYTGYKDGSASGNIVFDVKNNGNVTCTGGIFFDMSKLTSI